MSNTKKVLNSSILLVLVKFFQRTLGLISTLILARILVPEDFGIVALTAISVQFALVLSSSGIQQYIPQKDEVNDDDVNTAWSIDLCLKFILWLTLLLMAPLIGTFYSNDKVVLALQVVSVVVFLSALQNPGLHLLRRELSYKKIFWLGVTQKITSFIVVISIAWLNRSYWAMIVGDIVGAVVGVVGSYLLISYRPSFTLIKIKEQLAFSKWMLARGVVGFFRSQIDQLMVSKIFGLSNLGAYNVVRGISVLPATDIIVPSVEPLLASFSRVKQDVNQLGHQFRTSLLLIFILIMPICSFFCYYSEHLVLVLLGPSWKNYGSLLANFSLLLAVFSLGSVLGNFYLAVGKVRLIFYYNLISLFAIFGVLFVYSGKNVMEFALYRGGLGLISTLLWMTGALYLSKSNYFRFLLLVMPTIILSIVCAYLSRLLLPTFDNLLIETLFGGIIFGIFYVAGIVSCYLLLFNRFGEWQSLYKILLSLKVKAL